jgi:secreted Zn-dependent insulinase-like peptidase
MISFLFINFYTTNLIKKVYFTTRQNIFNNELTFKIKDSPDNYNSGLSKYMKKSGSVSSNINISIHIKTILNRVRGVILTMG